MPQLIYAFVEIALHRRGPDGLPASTFFFRLLLATWLAVSLFFLQFTNIPAGRVVPVIAVDTGFSLAFTWSVLRAFGVERRFLPTASAILGVNSLLDLVSLPFILWHRALHVPVGTPTVPSVIYQLIAFFWAIDVASFIISRAIERPYVLALAVVLAYVLLDVSLYVTLFPTGK